MTKPAWELSSAVDTPPMVRPTAKPAKSAQLATKQKRGRTAKNRASKRAKNNLAQLL